jgi:hypothetical protein
MIYRAHRREQDVSEHKHWREPMTKGELIAKYRKSSPEERRTIDRWLIANAVIVSIFAMALVVVALNGQPGFATDTVVAKGAQTEPSPAVQGP